MAQVHRSIPSLLKNDLKLSLTSKSSELENPPRRAIDIKLFDGNCLSFSN